MICCSFKSDQVYYFLIENIDILEQLNEIRKECYNDHSYCTGRFDIFTNSFDVINKFCGYIDNDFKSLQKLNSPINTTTLYNSQCHQEIMNDVDTFLQTWIANDNHLHY